LQAAFVTRSKLRVVPPVADRWRSGQLSAARRQTRSRRFARSAISPPDAVLRMAHLHTGMERLDIHVALKVCEIATESATAVAMPPCPSIQILRPNSIHHKPLMIDK
jgi:hypothetical protein